MDHRSNDPIPFPKNIGPPWRPTCHEKTSEISHFKRAIGENQQKFGESGDFKFPATPWIAMVPWFRRFRDRHRLSGRNFLSVIRGPWSASSKGIRGKTPAMLLVVLPITCFEIADSQ